MGTVTLTATQNAGAYADFAAPTNLYTFDPSSLELVVPDAAQATLDTALVNYAANQVAIDAAFTQARTDEALDRERDELDNQKILKALAELLVDEFNILRALHSLPLRTFAQLRTAIRNKVV